MTTSCPVTDQGGAAQLPLPLPVRSAFGAEDFLVTDSNRDAVRWLDIWPDWPGRGLLLHGPGASGKSHLAAIWTGRAGAITMRAADLTLQCALAPETPMVIEDVEAMPEPQVLFHLINAAHARNLSLLMTASRPAAEWSTGLADLDSRLRALPSVGMRAPDDALLGALAAKLFADRQITVPEAVIVYMVTHLERSCAAVALAVERLDRASLAQRRKITRQLAQEVLGP